MKCDYNVVKCIRRLRVLVRVHVKYRVRGSRAKVTTVKLLLNNQMLQFKLVLLGDSSVGKSSIVNRFVKDSFDEFRESTIGAAFLSQTIKIRDEELVSQNQAGGEGDGDSDNGYVTIKFEIWDTAGQERYKSLAPMYYRNANAALVVYDITLSDSLSKAQAWVDELKSKVGGDSNSNNNLVIYLVGNKLDLCQPGEEGEEISDKRAVKREDAEAYAAEHGLLFDEVSAKTGENVREIFFQIGERLYNIKKQELKDKGIAGSGPGAGSGSGTVNIHLPRPSTNDSTGCCS